MRLATNNSLVLSDMSNEDNPLVSVVVITYNSMLYVQRTLESILAQSYSNLELIISDDASSDETVTFCSQWMQKYADHFKRTLLVTSSVNTGIPSNANRGWKEGQGAWVKIIAGDDMLMPDCIAQNISFVNNNPSAVLVCSDALIIDEDSKVVDSSTGFYKGELDGLRHWFFSSSAYQQRKIYARNPIYLVTPSFFVKKSILERVGGFDERLRIFEDIVLVMKVLCEGSAVSYFSKETVCYRIHSGSVSRENSIVLQKRNLLELKFIYDHYRRRYLKWWHPWDLCGRLDAFLMFEYPQTFRLKGARFLRLLNPYRVYEKFKSNQYCKRD